MPKKQAMEFLLSNDDIIFSSKVWAANISKGNQFITTRRAYILKVTSTKLYAWKYKDRKSNKLPEPLLSVNIDSSQIINFDENKVFTGITIKSESTSQDPEKILLFEFRKKEKANVQKLLDVYGYTPVKPELEDNPIQITTEHPQSPELQEGIEVKEQPRTAPVPPELYQTPLEVRPRVKIETQPINSSRDSAMTVDQGSILQTIEYVEYGVISITEAKQWATQAKTYEITGNDPEFCEDALNKILELEEFSIASYYELVKLKQFL
jgi:hypothetical protein